MFNLAMRLHAVFAFHYSVFKDQCAVVQLYSIDTFSYRLSTGIFIKELTAVVRVAI
jgi:hypothetical protein